MRRTLLYRIRVKAMSWTKADVFEKHKVHKSAEGGSVAAVCIHTSTGVI